MKFYHFHTLPGRSASVRAWQELHNANHVKVLLLNGFILSLQTKKELMEELERDLENLLFLKSKLAKHSAVGLLVVFHI